MRGMIKIAEPNLSPSLIISKGAYTIEVQTRKSRIRTEKSVGVYENGRFTGKYTVKELCILMTQVTVNLIHLSGDVTTFRQTAMGKKASMTRSNNMTRAKVVNKTAFGPELLETGTKPESSTLDKAVATISRMTGMEPTETRRLFNYDLLEAGVVGR